MVKKSIIAIALMSMLASISYGAVIDLPGGQKYPPGDSTIGQVKIDGQWPATVEIKYTPQQLCRIPIYIKVGMFIEIINCGNYQITLLQVNCPQGQSFPCYAGCAKLKNFPFSQGMKARANFEAILSLKLYKIGTIISGSGGQWGGNWKAYFTQDGGATKPTTLVIPANAETAFDLCVEAWDVNIYDITPNSTQQVGEVAILAMPNGTPDICDYCP